MPSASAADVRAAIASRNPAPVYLILGDDDAEVWRLAADIAALGEDELRAFNVERIYAGEEGSSPSAIVEAARRLPMMSDRRVALVPRGDKLLKPKRRGRTSEGEDIEIAEEPARDPDTL